MDRSVVKRSTVREQASVLDHVPDSGAQLCFVHLRRVLVRPPVGWIIRLIIRSVVV
jgi:hypothetical protein